MNHTKSKLIEAEKIAEQLFNAVVARQLIKPGKSESELNEEVFMLADELFWNKKILAQENCTKRCEYVGSL